MITEIFYPETILASPPEDFQKHKSWDTSYMMMIDGWMDGGVCSIIVDYHDDTKCYFTSTYSESSFAVLLSSN